jgi:hypothetical protein
MKKIIFLAVTLLVSSMSFAGEQLSDYLYGFPSAGQMYTTASSGYDHCFLEIGHEVPYAGTADYRVFQASLTAGYPTSGPTYTFTVRDYKKDSLNKVGKNVTFGNVWLSVGQVSIYAKKLRNGTLKIRGALSNSMRNTDRYFECDDLIPAEL